MAVKKATAPQPETAKQTVARLRDEISHLTAELKRVQAELALTARQNRIARNSLMVARRGPLWRYWPYGLRQPTWMSEQMEALRKSRLFDETWYLAQNKGVRESGMDALSHYLLFGGFEGRKPNPIFDSKWYLETYPDVAAAGLNPLYHFITHGIREKRSAGPDFDTQYYLERNADIAGLSINPLLHYLRYGQKEGRVAVRGSPLAQRPRAPWDGQWRQLKPKTFKGPPEVDVVIPVHRGYEDTLACIYSVLTADVETPYELIVIDDCSPEEKLSLKLRKLSGKGLFSLLTNDGNLGFVRSVNRGMALHEDRDVILLNSDTVVYNDWIDRLRAQAQRQRAGTVTPFSSNATICSYPATLRSNPEQLEMDYAALDALAAQVNAGVAVDLPTAVGFCMYIKRDCLTQVGLFDAKSFGKGYGEENDFCRRAAHQGWRNLLAANVFVRHTGEVSFAETAAAGQTEALQALQAKHPDYNEVVRAHIRRNPAATARRRIDAARLRAHMGGPSILHVTHNWGGGIDHHIRGLIHMFRRDGTGGILMSAPERGKFLVNIYALDDLLLPNLHGLDINRDMDDLVQILQLAGVIRIHIHSLAGWPVKATTALRQLARKAGLSYDFTVHDYLAFCPRITLINGSGRYCGEKGLVSCHRCIAVNGTPFGRVNAGQWRRHYRHLLDGADNIFAPSRDACKRVSGYLDGRKVLLRPHPHVPSKQGRAALPWHPGETLRVMIIGAINEQKGSRLLLAMADDAARRKLPIEFAIVGHTATDGAFASRDNVSMTGRYREVDLFKLMAEQKAHAVFLSSVGPETFSYTLTSALEAGFPVAAFNIGAQAERVRELSPEAGLLIDLELAANPGIVNMALLGWMKDLQMPEIPLDIQLVSYTMDEYYGK